MKRFIVAVTLLLLAFQGFSPADTFTNKTKDIVYHGYATQDMVEGKNVVCTQEEGNVHLNLSEYDVEFNSTGRNNYIALLSICGAIASEHETNRVCKSACRRKPIKAPWRYSLKSIPPADGLTWPSRYVQPSDEIRSCQTIAYIKGGDNGGAFSAGAAVSMACNKIYMNPQTTIGGRNHDCNNEQRVRSGHETCLRGNGVGEKFNAAWRSYLASLAEKNNRSGALAKAMADKDIEVIEVTRNGQQLFIDSSDKRQIDVLVRTVCKKGELLAMPAKEALACNLSDGIVESRQELLSKLAISVDVPGH